MGGFKRIDTAFKERYRRGRKENGEFLDLNKSKVEKEKVMNTYKKKTDEPSRKLSRIESFNDFNESQAAAYSHKQGGFRGRREEGHSNIVMQLRSHVTNSKPLKVKFEDGGEHHIDRDKAQTFLSFHAKINKPHHKLKVQNHAAKGIDHFNNLVNIVQKHGHDAGLMHAKSSEKTTHLQPKDSRTRLQKNHDVIDALAAKKVFHKESFAGRPTGKHDGTAHHEAQMKYHDKVGNDSKHPEVQYAHDIANTIHSEAIGNQNFSKLAHRASHHAKKITQNVNSSPSKLQYHTDRINKIRDKYENSLGGKYDFAYDYHPHGDASYSYKYD